MKESETGQDTPRAITQEAASGEAVKEAAPQDVEPMLYCPVCSTRLTERKCKLFCAQCGYYLSCSDYY